MEVKTQPFTLLSPPSLCSHLGGSDNQHPKRGGASPSWVLTGPHFSGWNNHESQSLQTGGSSSCVTRVEGPEPPTPKWKSLGHLVISFISSFPGTGVGRRPKVSICPWQGSSI